MLVAGSAEPTNPGAKVIGALGSLKPHGTGEGAIESVLLSADPGEGEVKKDESLDEVTGVEVAGAMLVVDEAEVLGGTEFGMLVWEAARPEKEVPECLGGDPAELSQIPVPEASKARTIAMATTRGRRDSRRLSPECGDLLGGVGEDT